MDKQNITVLRKILYAVESEIRYMVSRIIPALPGSERTVAMKKLLRSARASGTQEKQKNCYTGFREQTRSYSKTWIMQAWKKTC